jgi:hypothetical protein
MEKLPTAPNPLGDEFRRSEMEKYREYLIFDSDMRGKYYSRYKKIYNATSITSSSMNVLAVGAGVSGISILCTVVAIPIGIGLEAASVAFSAFGFLANHLQNKAQKKFEKHDEIKILSISKLNTINGLISKAYSDGNVTEEEYNLIMKEKDDYFKLKQMIKDRYRKKLAVGNKNPPVPIP